MAGKSRAGKTGNPVPAASDDVANAFAAFPGDARKALMAVRSLIFETAEAIEAVGPLTETLKWGEPAYLTEATKAGSTIRLGWKAKAPDECALYFNCNTTLVDTFRTRFPELRFSGNRALLLDVNAELPRDALADCIEQALTYHLNKRKGARAGRASRSLDGGRAVRSAG